MNKSNIAQVIIIGYHLFIDYIEMSKEETSKKILQMFAYNNYTIQTNIYDFIDKLCGRFVVLIFYNQQCYVFNDACGLKSVYYHNSANILASHASMLDAIIKSDKPILEYYKIFDECKNITCKYLGYYLAI